MNLLNRTTLAVLLIAFAMPGICQDQSETGRTAGLRKIATGSGNRELEIEIEESVEASIEVAMEAVEVALENLEVDLERMEFQLDNLDIDIDPIEINIPDILQRYHSFYHWAVLRDICQYCY